MPEIILPFFTKNLDKKNMESIIKGAFKKKKKSLHYIAIFYKDE